MDRRAVLALAATVGLAPAATRADTSSLPPKRYFVLQHAPGPAWDHAKRFGDQPGIDGHVQYMQGYFDQDKLVLGGPFLDDSGGMMIFDVASLAEAQAIANGDPTVKAGLLQVAVRPWLAAFRES